MARPPTGQIVERAGARGTRYAIRFRAYGKRHYLTLNVSTRAEAERALAHTLADVERGIWKPPASAAAEEPREEPSFHVLASEWLERRRLGGAALRTVENWRWALELHLLPAFGGMLPSAIGPAEVERYKTAKLRERDWLRAQLEAWQAAAPESRGNRPPRPLGNEAINRTLKVLAMVLDDAVDFGYLDSNPARGRNRRLKAGRPRRTWLSLDELRALLDAAGPEHRPLLATMALAGLRVSEACALRWRDVDLANGRLRVEASKTDAGVRVVDLTPMLRDELAAAKASVATSDPDAIVFPTRAGTPRDRNNVRSRVLAPAIQRANRALTAYGKPPLQDGVTNHTLRRTFCALLYEAGASPAYAMAQMGHSSAALALEVYSRVMERKRDTGERMDALLRAADWAPMGTNGIERAESLPASATENPA